MPDFSGRVRHLTAVIISRLEKRIIEMDSDPHQELWLWIQFMDAAANDTIEELRTLKFLRSDFEHRKQLILNIIKYLGTKKRDDLARSFIPYLIPRLGAFCLCDTKMLEFLYEKKPKQLLERLTEIVIDRALD